MTKCVPFVAKKALIIHQSDYSSTRLICKNSFGDLPDTKQDAINATHLAHGFGIADHDIIYIEDVDLPTINKKIYVMKKELKDLAL